MSSSASRSSAADVPTGAKRWNKKSSDGEKTVIAHLSDGPPLMDDDDNNQGGEDAGQEDHAGVPTPSDFLGPDLPGKVPAKVLAAITSREEADTIKKHGLYMLLLCAEADDNVFESLEDNRMYQLVDEIDAKGKDNRKEINRLLVEKYLPRVEMVPLRAGLQYLVRWDGYDADWNLTPPEVEALIAVYSVGLYGLNHIQCYWLLDNLINKEDDLPSLTNDEGAMSCLFSMIKNNVVPTADFWSSGNGPIEQNKKSTDFTVAHPGLIYKYNKFVQPGWSAPTPHDPSVQGKPSQWKEQYQGSFSLQSYFLLTLTGSNSKWDQVPDIFNSNTSASLPGAVGMDMLSSKAGSGKCHKFLWNLYAWMSARPTINGYMILDLVKIPRKWTTYTTKGNPTELLKAALITRAGTFAAKGGIQNDGDNRWDSNNTLPIYGKHFWPTIADVIKMFYAPPKIEEHLSHAARLLFDPKQPLTMIDRVDIESARVHKVKWDRHATCWSYTYFHQQFGDAGVANNLERLYDLEQKRIQKSEPESTFANNAQDAQGMLYTTPVFRIPINRSSESAEDRKARGENSNFPKIDDVTPLKDQRVLSGVKPTALQSILEHGKIKTSRFNEMDRGEADCSNTKSRLPVSWGFDSYNPRLNGYATWTFIGQGLYLQVWLELETEQGKDWKLEKQSKDKEHLPEQMGFNENHRVSCLCIRIIHVNALRAYRPSGCFNYLTGFSCRSGTDWYKDLPVDPNNQGYPVLSYPIHCEATHMDFSVIYDFFANNMQARGFTAKNIKDACAMITNAASTASGHGHVIDIEIDDESSNKRKPNTQNVGTKWLKGKDAHRVNDRRTSPSIVFTVGESSGDGQWMDYTSYDKVTSSMTRREKQRIANVVLDYDLKEALEDIANRDADALAETERINQLKDMCKDSQELFPAWMKSCESLVKLFAIIYPNMYPNTVLDKMCRDLTSPRAAIALLERHGCPDGKTIAHKIMTGIAPPTADFIASADATFLLDSIGSINIPLTSSDPDEQFANALDNFGSSKKMQFTTFLDRLVRGHYPIDVEKLKRDTEDMIRDPEQYVSKHWKARKGKKQEWKDPWYGAAYHREYFERWPSNDKDGIGRFPSKAAEVTRIKMVPGTGVVNFKMWVEDYKNDMIQQLRNGESLCAHRTCVVAWFGNDFVRKSTKQDYVIPEAAFETDVKLFVEDLLLALESTFDKFCFVTGTTSEFHFDERVPAYDFLVKRSIEFIRERGVLVFTAADALNNCIFRDTWHLKETITNAYRLAGVLAAASRILSWLCINEDLSLDRWWYGGDMFVQGSLSFRLNDPESAVIELSNNVPELNGIIDDDVYQRFLGGSVPKICRKFLRDLFVEAALRRIEHDAAMHGEGQEVTNVQVTEIKESVMLEDELDGVWGDPALASTKKDHQDEETKEAEPSGKPANDKKQIRPPLENADNPWERLAEKAGDAPFNVFNRDYSEKFPALPKPGIPPRPTPKTMPKPKQDASSVPTDSNKSEMALEASTLKARVMTVCKSWNLMVKTKVLAGFRHLDDPDDDPFGMEDLGNSDLVRYNSAGKGKRTLGGRYQGIGYSIPYKGAIYIGNFAFDIGNVLLQYFLLVPGFTCNRVIPGMDTALRALVEITHPDAFFFITWGREAKGIIKNLAGINFQNYVLPINQAVKRGDRILKKDPRFSATLYQLFRKERGCQGSIVCPAKSNPMESDDMWTDGPETVLVEDDSGSYPELSASEMDSTHEQYERFSKYGRDWKGKYNFISANYKHGTFQRDGSYTVEGKIIACKEKNIRVLVDDHPKQCKYVDKMRSCPDNEAHAAMPIFVQEGSRPNGETYWSNMESGYEGYTVGKAIESIGVIAEFCFQAIQHNEKNGHRQSELGPKAHFGPKWDSREIAQIKPYPSAFGIPADRGVDLARLGIPAYDEDGDITTRWYDPKVLVGGLLEGTDVYKRLKEDIREFNERRANPSASKKSEQVNPADDSEPLLASEQKDLDTAKIEDANLKKFGDVSGKCSLCKSAMTYKEFASHVCAKAVDVDGSVKLMTWSADDDAGFSDAVPTAMSSGAKPAPRAKPRRIRSDSGDRPTQPKAIKSIDDIDFDNLVTVDDEKLKSAFIKVMQSRSMVIGTPEYFAGVQDLKALYLNPDLTQYNNNGVHEGTAEEIRIQLDILASYRKGDGECIYWHEDETGLYGISHQDTGRYLERDNLSYMVEDSTGGIVGIGKVKDWYPTITDADLERTPRYVRFKRDTLAFHRKLYLFHPADSRSLNLERFGAIIENVSPDMAMGRIHRIRWSYNLCAAMVRAPKLADLESSKASLHKGIASAYAHGYIPFVWVVVWSSLDDKARPIGNTLADISKMSHGGAPTPSDEIFGSVDSDNDGMAISRDVIRCKSLFAHLSAINGEDPYERYRRRTQRGGDADGSEPNSEIGDPFDELNDREKYGVQDQSDEFKEWKASNSAIHDATLPEAITMVRIREILEAEQARVGDKHAHIKEHFPNLDFLNFRYFAQVTAPKCPLYRNRYDVDRDFAKQCLENSMGSERNCAYLPDGKALYWFEGPDTILRKGEKAEISSIDYPSGPFQAAKLTNILQYKDAEGVICTEHCVYINLFKGKVPLYQGDRYKNVRYTVLFVLPGSNLVQRIRASPLSRKLADPDILSGNTAPTQEQLGATDDELKALSEFLQMKFNSHAKARSVNAQIQSRIDVSDIDMRYLRKHGIMDQDDEIKHRETLREIKRAMANFLRSQCPECPTTQVELARRTSIRTRCEETESITVNAAVLRKYISFDKVKGFSYDGIQPREVKKQANVILSGDPAVCPEMEEGCWMPIKPLMETLQKRLSEAYKPHAIDPADGCTVVRGAVCSVHKLLLALADTTQCPFEIRLQLAESPTDTHAMNDSVDHGGSPRYLVIPCYGVDVALCASNVPVWVSTHEEHLEHTSELSQYTMPTKWDARLVINYTDGIMRDEDLSFKRMMVVTHIRRAHGLSGECKYKPKQWFDFCKSMTLRIADQDFTEEHATTELKKVPKIMYIVTKKRYLKHISKMGCVVSESTYPISDNLEFDPNDMRTPILLSSVQPWDVRSNITPGGYLRADTNGFCYLVVDTEALYFDGWTFSLHDDGIWRTWNGFGNGYLIGAFQTNPTIQLIQWRSFVRIGFDFTSNPRWGLRYKRYRNNDGEMNVKKALLDKAMPVKHCIRCGVCLTIDTFLCAECEFPSFCCTWIQTKWMPPRTMETLGMEMRSQNQFNAFLNYCHDVCAREDESAKHDVGRKWDPEFHSWIALPLNKIGHCSALRADVAKYCDQYHGDLGEDTFGIFSRSMQTVYDRTSGSDHERATTIKNIKGVADFVRLCVLAGSLSKVLDAAVTRKLELEQTKRMDDILSAVKKVSGTVVDISALERAGYGSDRSRIKQDQWRESPERLATRIDTRESKAVSNARTYVENNPGITPGSPALSIVGATLSRFTSGVDRMTRDTVFRLRLEQGWIDCQHRIDVATVRHSTYHYLAWCYEEKMRVERLSAKPDDRQKYVWVPKVVDLAAGDDRDIRLEKLRGRPNEIWLMAEVTRIEVKELDKWLKDNELIVPHTQIVAKRSRFRFDATLSATSILNDGDAIGDGSVDPGHRSAITYVWEYVRGNACCKCGNKHPRVSGTRVLSCAICRSPVCNEECAKKPCKGDPFVGGLIPPANVAIEKNVVRPVHDDPIAEDRIAGEGGITSQRSDSGFATNAVSTAGHRSRSSTETAFDGKNLPMHKRQNPHTKSAYTFDELEDMRTGANPSGRYRGRDQPQHDASWDQRARRQGWDNDSWHGNSKHWSSHNESGWHSGGWNQGWHKGHDYRSGVNAASTAKNWGYYSKQDYSATKRQQKDSWGRPPWNREDHFEERNAKRKERYETTESNEQSEFQDFIDGAKEEEGERLRRAKPSRPACSDIRKEYTPTVYRERWAPSLRENPPAASSSTDLRLRSVPRDSRSRSPPNQQRGISGTYRGDNGETVEYWAARPSR